MSSEMACKVGSAEFGSASRYIQVDGGRRILVDTNVKRRAISRKTIDHKTLSDCAV